MPGSDEDVERDAWLTQLQLCTLRAADALGSLKRVRKLQRTTAIYLICPQHLMIIVVLFLSVVSEMCPYCPIGPFGTWVLREVLCETHSQSEPLLCWCTGD